MWYNVSFAIILQRVVFLTQNQFGGLPPGEVENRLTHLGKIVDSALESTLPRRVGEARLLREALAYSVKAGGKRLRPVLCLSAAEALGKNADRVLPAACALELIHTYSLIHDDLPAMDDDDMRRGIPTNHKVFGEGMAVLAGDALLTLAFEILASLPGISPRLCLAAIQEVARAAGYEGMVGGQAVDLLSEGGGVPPALRHRRLAVIHRGKTGALIRASLLTGALLSQATSGQRDALGAYGEHLGLAFQIADDVLDVVGDKKLLGKNGSDAANGKLTFPQVYGLEASQRRARRAAENAKRALRPLGSRAAFLVGLADYVVERKK